jgi:squalene-associated FAD-dependent desaturase
MNRGRVTVVGGGLAGIAAALRCADLGARVTLLEVRPRLGGAAYSFEREGLSLDNGQHVFLRCCTAYRELLRRIGSEDATRLQPRLRIEVLAPGGRRGRLGRAGLPAPLHLAPALARYPFLAPRERAAAARSALALRRLDPDDPALDRRSFGDWLAERGQGPAAMEALWNLIALPTLNLSADRASLALAARVFRTGLLDEPDAGDVGFARAPLGEVHDRPARRALDTAGVDVRLGWRATAIHAGAGGPLEVEGAGDRVEADAVVLAVPHDRVHRLLPDGALPDPAAPARLGASPIVNLHVFYDRPITGLAFAAAVQSPVQWIFDRTRAAGLHVGQYLAVSLSGAEREMAESTEELRARFLPALAELLPDARDARVERFLVTREHCATFQATPGSRAFRPGPSTGVPGLFLAGAWTDTGWPATMEGAVRSGLTAASRAARVAAGAGALEGAVS